MNEILKLYISISILSSVLIAILLLFKPLYKDKLSKTWQYYIWLIIIIRLVIPFSLEVESVNEAVYKLENYFYSPSDEIFSERLKNDSDDFQADAQLEIYDIKNIENNIVSPQNVLFKDVLKIIKENIGLIWIFIFLILLTRKIINFSRFTRIVRINRKKVHNPNVIKIYEDILNLYNLKNLPLYECKLISSPMLVGVLKPAIILPNINKTDIELKNIFLHEITHYNRLDSFYKWFVQIAICLHWFNPIVYLIVQETNKNCELSCDEQIIKHYDYFEKRCYGDTLLGYIESNNMTKYIHLSLNENSGLLKERLRAIMEFHKKSKLNFIISLFLVIIISLIAIVGVYASSGNAKEVNEIDAVEKTLDTPTIDEKLNSSIKTDVSISPDKVENFSENSNIEEYENDDYNEGEIYKQITFDTINKMYTNKISEKEYNYHETTSYSDENLMHMQVSPKDIDKKHESKERVIVFICDYDLIRKDFISIRTYDSHKSRYTNLLELDDNNNIISADIKDKTWVSTAENILTNFFGQYELTKDCYSPDPTGRDLQIKFENDKEFITLELCYPSKEFSGFFIEKK